MSSTVSTKQQPVLTRLHDTLLLAHAYACAICDNAQDDASPIPLEVVAAFQSDCDRIINALSEAAAQ